MYCAPSLLILQCFTLLLATPVSVSQVTTRYVGEELSLGCTRDGGGGPGRWYINGVYTNVTAAQFVDTIEVVDGELNYDGTLRCEGGDSYSMKTYGLFGVSPSPLNCSSTDTTTNTCTVSALVNSSLTLCADFTRYPSDAPRFADINEAYWAIDNTWLWHCSPECIANPAVSVNIIFTNQWGTCAQVESIQEDASLSFSVFTSPPPNSGIGKNLHSQAGLFQKVYFNIQVERLPSSTSPSPSSSSTQVPHSTTSSQPRVTSTIRLTSAESPIPTLNSPVTDEVVPVPNESSNPPSIAPLPDQSTEQSNDNLQGAITITYITAIVAVVSVTAILTGIILIILCRIMCMKKKLSSLQRSKWISSKNTKLRHFNQLHFKDSTNTIESGLASTSTLKPFLGSSNMSIVLPEADHQPETIVTDENPFHSEKFHILGESSVLSSLH